MIWFGKHPGLRFLPAVRGRVPLRDRDRMRCALERVATRAPHLYGAALLDALEATGWVDRETAERLLPHFHRFDADRHFAEHMRRLSFRGPSVGDEFQSGIIRIVDDLTGTAEPGQLLTEAVVRFAHADREGIVLAYPEVNLSLGPSLRGAVVAAVEEMPDALVLVARNFQPGTAEQLASLLARTEVPGTLVTVNLLLGMRATRLRYQPSVDRVLELLGAGRPLRSVDVARLGDREEEPSLHR
jgi:hypothetical protein